MSITPYVPERFDILGICAPDIDPLTFEELQRAICSIDHDEEHMPDYFYKLSEEVGELSAAVRKDIRWNKANGSPFKGSIEEELCDVVYYTLALANLYHVDITQCLYEKEKLNVEKYSRPNVLPPQQN